LGKKHSLKATTRGEQLRKEQGGAGRGDDFVVQWCKWDKCWADEICWARNQLWRRGI